MKKIRLILSAIIYKLYTYVLPKKGDLLSLIHVSTLPNGVPIYTYKPENLADVSSRFYTALCKAHKSLENYGVFHNVAQKHVELIREKAEAVQSDLMSGAENSFADANNKLLDIIMMSDNLKLQNRENFIIDDKIRDIMLCMFYLLPEEVETGYNEVLNDKKINLFNQYPTEREFFFAKLETIISNYKPTSYKDLLKLILEVVRLKGITSHLNSN